AGSWYPASRSSCEEKIKSFIDENLVLKSEDLLKIAGIVPHAGWVFSGKTACNVIKILSEDNGCDTVVVFGSHMGPNDRNFLMNDGFWDTPLGELKIDSEIASGLCKKFDFIVETAHSFQPDNTIELQLPFIKYFFEDVQIVPIGIAPRGDSLDIVDYIIDNFKDKSIKYIGSTDLTHYGPNYGFSPHGIGYESVEWVKNENDKKIIDLMVSLDEDSIINEAFTSHNVCCPGAVVSTIHAGVKNGAKKGELLEYTTSYDISPSNSFVGYAGIVF
ncbi:AmmeMemoRadiSam system protein B, partial [candidate division KSB1 bacterium]